MENEITIAERELIIKMDSDPGCFLRPHMMVGGRRQRGFRLLDRNLNPLMTVRYHIVEQLVEAGYIQPLYQGGALYHYFRTHKKLNKYE